MMNSSRQKEHIFWRIKCTKQLNCEGVLAAQQMSAVFDGKPQLEGRVKNLTSPGMHRGCTLL